MRQLADLASLAQLEGPLHLCLGMFDGVHLGHQSLVKQAVEQRRTVGGTAVALSFSPHPAEVLRPGAHPPLLTCPAHRTSLLLRYGLDSVVVHPFTVEFSRLSPLEFLDLLARSARPLGSLICGGGFRFGHKGEGTTADLTAFCTQEGVNTFLLPPVEWEGLPVSSTRIRNALTAGNLDAAEAMLGRPTSLWGTVERGKQLGGTIGFPTANVEVSNEALPPHGVYAVASEFQGRRIHGVANLGLRPTVGDRIRPLLEAHWFDFKADLYGVTMEIEILHQLREERRFESISALRDQIEIDTASARAFFSQVSAS